MLAGGQRDGAAALLGELRTPLGRGHIHHQPVAHKELRDIVWAQIESIDAGLRDIEIAFVDHARRHRVVARERSAVGGGRERQCRRHTGLRGRELREVRNRTGRRQAVGVVGIGDARLRGSTATATRWRFFALPWCSCASS